MRFWLAAFFVLAGTLAAEAQTAGGMTGLYRGIVTSSDDPQGQSRLRVRIVEIGTEAWALGSVPYGQQVSPPPPGTTVWILFEDGDAARPVWIGVLPAAERDHGQSHRRWP